MRRVLLLCAMFAALPAWTAEQETFSEHVLDVSPDVTLSGAIDPDALREQIPGKVMVIDLRTPAEKGVKEEGDAVRALGMGYRNLPVSGPVIDPANVAYLETMLKTSPPGEHLVIHCASGNRAGMMWGAVMLDSGEGVDEVIEEVSPIVTHEPLQDALRSYADASNAP